MSDDLGQTHAQWRKDAKAGRRRFAKSPEGKLAAAMRHALELRDRMRADGATPAEVEAVVEGALRAAWPFTREWKYLCDHCRDLGLVMGECPGDATCGRSQAHGPHSFGTPCWCSLGARFKPAERPAGIDLTSVGKTKRREGFTRMGR